MVEPVFICDATEVGALGILHLKRLWSKTIRNLLGQGLDKDTRDEWQCDVLVMDGLGLGLYPTLEYLYLNAPTYEAFEAWILDTHGGYIDPAIIDWVNAAIRRVTADEMPSEGVTETSNELEPVFSAADLASWEEQGYVVVPNAISHENCLATEKAIWEFLEADPEKSETWYDGSKRNGIWVPLYRHPILEANRQSSRIWQAFAQLYGTDQLSCSLDQVGFNPPERPGSAFPGPFLHWDTSLELPIPLGLQGILYVTDTEAEQGAFTCVPGFHRNIADWLRSLPPDAEPREQDLDALGAQPIAGKAGDLIIWHHALPHGSRPNRLTRPRMVQYIKLYPIQYRDDRQWR